MRERIVVSFRSKLVSMRDDELASFRERARFLRAHADALGATLCSFGGSTFSFELHPDSFEKAVVLVAQACDELSRHPRPSFGMGISQGFLYPAFEEEGLGWLASGIPLVTAIGLASIARPGEVLIDPALAADHGELPSCGMSVGMDGEREIRGLILDPLYVPTLSLPAFGGARRLTSIPLSQSSGPERRQGMEALSKGDVVEALVALRRGVEKTMSAPPEERARALLAHSVALSAGGDEKEALLEGLEALARAREARDRRGEEACARFLATLTEKAGRGDLALTWRRVAEIRTG